MAELAETDVAVVPLHEVRHNLPTHLSSFVGRERELSEVAAALSHARVLTLTGAGGCGKSRLAARAAAQALHRFQHGAWWVELAPLTEPRMVELALAQSLDVRPGPGESGLDAVVHYLAPRRALLVLDNCEHLLDECARVAETLATECPGVTVLATSRESLRIAGETAWRVPSLSLPPDGDDAVTLFVERARQFRPGFVLTDQADATALCRHLDGIPLAIELAAARLPLLTVRQIAEGLADRFAMLAHGSRTAADRQQTLHASVGWSHDLLDDTERAVFRRLGVFLGGFTLEAAQQVCAIDLDPIDVFEPLAALVDKSLIQVEERDRTIRYRLLETLRAYALERLEEAGETAPAHDRHRDYYLSLAERLEPDLQTARQLDAMDLLDPEQANVALAIEHAAGTEPEKALRLCAALALWWQMRGLLRNGAAACRVALDAAPREPSVPRARALYAHTLLLTFAGAVDKALASGQEAMSLAQIVGDQQTVARCLQGVGVLAVLSDPIGSHAWLEQARDLAIAVGDDLTVAGCTQALAWGHLHHTDIRGAEPVIEEALRLTEALGNRDLLAWSLAARAYHACLSGDLDTCRTAADRAVRNARLVGDVPAEMAGCNCLALGDINSGNPPTAIARLMAVWERARTLGTGIISAALESLLVMADAADGRLADAERRGRDVIDRGADGYLMALLVAQECVAEVLRLRGDDADAQAVLSAGLALAERNNDQYFAAGMRLTAGRLAIRRGEVTTAHHLHHEALTGVLDNGYRTLLPEALEAIAETTAALGHPLDAARTLGAAARVRNDLGLVDWKHRRAQVDALGDRLRVELGSDEFDQACVAGRELSTNAALAFVRRGRGVRGRPPSGWDSLTPTERQVAELVGQGMTNPQIAARLFVSRETVKGHVSAALRKLGVANRTELAAEVTRHA